jgi:ABC-type antimicrobial peptide transport system permease subunit
MAVGASRGQLVVHLLIESCLIAVAGGLLGLLVAHATLGGIVWMLPADIVDQADLVLNRGALVSAAVLTVSTGFLFGFLPAVQATRPDVMAMLKDEGSTTTGARTAVRVRAALVTGQIALSMALLIVRQKAPMAVAGTVIGLAAGIGLGRVAESLLFELRGYDPTVVLAAALAMLVVACGASAVPTYRACRVDPTRALRHQ